MKSSRVRSPLRLPRQYVSAGLVTLLDYVQHGDRPPVQVATTVNAVTSGDDRPSNRPSRSVLQTIAFLGYAAATGIVWWLLQVVSAGWPYHHLRLWLPLVAIPYWIVIGAVVKRRYGIDLSARLTKDERRALRPRRQRWARPLRWIFGYVLTPVMLVVGLLVGIAVLPIYWDAAHGGGSVGQLTLTNEKCSSGSCTWYGVFVSDDKKYDYSDVEMEDPVTNAAVGASVRARYEDSLGEAFAIDGSRAYVPWAWTTAICGAYAVGGIVWLGIYVVRRRKTAH